MHSVPRDDALPVTLSPVVAAGSVKGTRAISSVVGAVRQLSRFVTRMDLPNPTDSERSVAGIFISMDRSGQTD